MLRVLLDRYLLQLLAVPRRDSTVGDLYVQQGRRVASPGNVAYLLTPPLQVAADRVDEPMSDISGTLTQSVGLTAGLGFLEGALTAMGASAVVQQLRVGVERQRVTGVRFGFQNVLRTSVDALALGQQLWRHTLDRRNAVHDRDNRYFLVTATASSDEVTLEVDTDSATGAQLDVEALAIASAHTGVSVQRSSRSGLSFAGRRLVFGVELHELVYDEARGNLKLKIAQRPIPVRGRSRRAGGPQQGAGPHLEPAHIDTGTDDLLLALDEIRPLPTE